MAFRDFLTEVIAGAMGRSPASFRPPEEQVELSAARQAGFSNLGDYREFEKRRRAAAEAQAAATLAGTQAGTAGQRVNTETAEANLVALGFINDAMSNWGAVKNVGTEIATGTPQVTPPVTPRVPIPAGAGTVLSDAEKQVPLGGPTDKLSGAVQTEGDQRALDQLMSMPMGAETDPGGAGGMPPLPGITRAVPDARPQDDGGLSDALAGLTRGRNATRAERAAAGLAKQEVVNTFINLGSFRLAKMAENRLQDTKDFSRADAEWTKLLQLHQLALDKQSTAQRIAYYQAGIDSYNKEAKAAMASGTKFMPTANQILSIVSQFFNPEDYLGDKDKPKLFKQMTLMALSLEKIFGDRNANLADIYNELRKAMAGGDPRLFPRFQGLGSKSIHEPRTYTGRGDGQPVQFGDPGTNRGIVTVDPSEVLPGSDQGIGPTGEQRSVLSEHDEAELRLRLMRLGMNESQIDAYIDAYDVFKFEQ